jgi:hypothetical protein
LRSISEPITPNSVARVNTVRCVRYGQVADVDLKQNRIERLKQFAKSRAVLESPSALGKLIGKEANQVTNLLGGHSSFGEKVARSIEEKAGLPRGWLDSPEATVPELSPEMLALAQRMDRLEPDARDYIMKQCRAFLLLQEPAAVSDVRQKRTRQQS